MVSKVQFKHRRLKSSGSSDSLSKLDNLAVEFVDSIVASSMNKIEDIPDLPIKIAPENTPMFTNAKKLDSNPDQENQENKKTDQDE